MKKWIIAVCAVVLAGLIIAIYPVWRNYNIIQFKKTIDVHFSRHIYKDATAISFGNTTVLLDPSNTLAIQKAITRTGINKAAVPKFDESEAVCIVLGEDAKYYILSGHDTSAGKDVAYIVREAKGRRVCFKLVGFKTMERVVECCSPEGYIQPNTIVG